MQQLDMDAVKRVLNQLKQVMDEQRERLLELDRNLGDGDLGITMTRAFHAAAETARTTDETLPGKLLMRAGMAMAKAAPSTMGTLLATGMMRGGKAVGDAEQIDVAQLAAFFRAFTDGIIERGKTRPGNKTVVDSLDPAATALQQAAAHGKDLHAALADAVAAARQGNEDARMMKAEHGKAAVYQDATIGKEDPGAYVGVLVVEGFASGVSNARAAAE